MNNSRPAPLRTDDTRTFARFSMETRVPRIIRETQTLNPDYSPSIQSALDTLAEHIEADAVIPMIDLPAPDYDNWQTIHAVHAGQTWLNADWLYAEMFMYRHLLRAVRWWETGRDPFAPKKAEELASAALGERLELALTVRAEPPEERLIASLHDALWGNRVDLSYAVAASHGSVGAQEDLLVDDSPAVLAHLFQSAQMGRDRQVHIVTDNAGTELAADLALVDTLLATNFATRVTLHVKLHPTYVSDATANDVRDFIALMAGGAHGGAARDLAARLTAALNAEQVRLAPDGYWNQSRFIRDLPPRLIKTFSGAALVVFKGDANYRRLIDDALWPPETPLSEVVAGFPAPLLALRTLKSDPVVGLPPGLAAHLDTVDAEWRINGKRAVLQFAPGMVMP